ncbi:hypothetical protein [Dactylosporangium sp. NPDC000521]|uniref:hypothetical protein n=1 Tax=Dactylosporangium sp. NPDC000521 TaxID=3363975 RepID=UPI0036A9EDAA
MPGPTCRIRPDGRSTVTWTDSRQRRHRQTFRTRQHAEAFITGLRTAQRRRATQYRAPTSVPVPSAGNAGRPAHHRSIAPLRELGRALDADAGPTTLAVLFRNVAHPDDDA